MDTKLDVSITVCGIVTCLHNFFFFYRIHTYDNKMCVFFCQVYDGDDYSLEGDMSVPSPRNTNSQPGQPDFNTLDEPVKETIVS